MANTPDYSWPPMESRKIIGKSPKRLDGPQKASGRAKYTSDLNMKDLLYGAYLTCPHGHARVTSIDTSAAEKMNGVKAVHVVAEAGKELQWHGQEVAAVAATTEEVAREAVRKIKVEYEVMPHFVNEADLGKAGSRGKAAGEKVTGDPEKAMQDAEAVSDGTYGIPVITHCCLEPHGLVIQWQGDQVMAWPSTQFVTGWAGTLAPNLKVPVANIKVKMDYIGGGFGSKFSPGAWAEVGARLSQKAGGKPVKLFLDRASEQQIPGNRPSAFGKIKVAGKKDGTITAWQSDTWASGGFAGGGQPPLPYVYTNIPNTRLNHVSVSVNAGPAQAWRAPNNQQASFLTCSAIEDFAAKVGVDPMVVFDKNAGYTPRAEQYRYQLQKAAELSEWSKLWKPRGSQTGTVRRGLGIGVNAWGGAGHACTARTTINPDGSVLLEMGTQDLGTGTRTIMTQVAAETLGLQMSQIKLVIGDNSLPAGRQFRRIHHGRWRLLGHAQIGRQRPRQALRSGRAGAQRPTRGPGSRRRHGPRQERHQEEHDLGRRLQEDRSRRQDQRDRRQRAAQSHGPQQRRRGRRAGGRRQRRHRNRPGQNQPLCGRAGLRPHHQPAAGRKPGLRRHHHGHLHRPL